MESKKLESKKLKTRPHIPFRFCKKKLCAHGQVMEKMQNVFENDMEKRDFVIPAMHSCEQIVETLLGSNFESKTEMPETIYVTKYNNINAPPRLGLSTTYCNGREGIHTKLYPNFFQMKTMREIHHDLENVLVKKIAEFKDHFDPTDVLMDLGMEIRISTHMDMNKFMNFCCTDECMCTCDKVSFQIES